MKSRITAYVHMPAHTCLQAFQLVDVTWLLIGRTVDIGEPTEANNIGWHVADAAAWCEP